MEKIPVAMLDGKVIADGIEEPRRNVFFLLSIVTYEIGDVERDVILDSSNLKLSLADAFTQMSLLCKELNVDEKKLRRKVQPGINLPANLLVLLGNLHRSIVYMKRFPDKKGYVKDVKNWISNLSIRLSEVCSEKELDEEEVRELGWEHLRERFKEFKEDGWVQIK